MENLGIEKTFFEVLKYPPYAIAEHWNKLQQESGWSRGTFFTAVWSEYRFRVEELEEVTRHKKNEHPLLEPKDIGLPLKQVSKGLISEAYTPDDGLTTILNKPLLDALHGYIRRAAAFGEPPKTYSDIQVISYAEKALSFILRKLNQQAASNLNTGGGVVLLEFAIRLPAPVFDFDLSADSIRDLLLNSPNSHRVEFIVKPLYERGLEIVSLWNEKIWHLENEYQGDTDKVRKNREFFFFDESKREVETFWGHTFFEDPSKLLTNQDLVLFAAKVGHLVAREVMDIPDETPKLNDSAPQKLADFFSSEADYNSAINALRKLNIVDDKNKSMVGPALKGIIQVWVHLLRYDRRTLRQGADTLLTTLINNEFPGLGLGEGTKGRHLRNPLNKTANTKYRSKLLSLIR